MTMTKREYLSLCLRMPVSWLRHSVANPSGNMTATHIALQRLAIRKLAQNA